MASHRGRDSTNKNKRNDFFWHVMLGSVGKYVKRCKKAWKNARRNAEVMEQIGVDICNLPEVNEYKHLVLCIDYISQWSEAKPLKDKLTESVSLFLYEIICRHG